MARKCPNCMAAVPATKVIPYSNNIVCEPCKSRLEISGFSRNISAFVSLIVAFIIFRITSAYYSQMQSSLGWVFPVLFAYLAYSIAAPMVLLFIADLQLRPFELEPAQHNVTSTHHLSH
jgi:hypothetical protein